MFVIERIISTIAPHTCLVCGDEGAVLCAWCLPDAVQLVPERCYRCKQISEDSRVCQKCRRLSRLRHVWVRAEYNDLIKKLVHRFKFSHAQAAAKTIAGLMDEALPWITPETLVVHIPTATSRRRQRGYDHAELLARHLAHNRGLKHLPLLARIGQSRQVGAKREERIQQLKQAFRTRREHLIKGSHVLLVDDITTTGATLEAAARTLKQAGAKTVDAVVLAQKQ